MTAGSTLELRFLRCSCEVPWCNLRDDRVDEAGRFGSAMASPSRVMTGSPVRLAHPGEPESFALESLIVAFCPGTRAHTQAGAKASRLEWVGDGAMAP